MTAYIISLPPHTPINSRCIATPPHRPPPRTSPHQVEPRRSLTLPNVVLSEKNATNLQVRRVASHQVRNAARCVLSLSLSEHAPLSHHHLRLPHSDESRFMEGVSNFSSFLQRVSRRATRYSSSPHRRDRDGRSFPRLPIHNLVSWVRPDSFSFHAYPRSHNTVLSCIP